MSDLENVRCQVLPSIADHRVVLATLKLSVPKSETVQRKVWKYAEADWEALEEVLGDECWDFLDTCSANEGALRLTERFWTLARPGYHKGN